ncbi:MAG TPA: polysaccharide deacetylase family protein [Acidobacteriaceae bacterium]|nr:polysaccharide deacetylase family protein [Acidobacteriaceae bacterium]
MHADSNSEGRTQRPSQRLYLLYHELRSAGSRYSYVTGAEMFEKHANIYAQLRTAADGSFLWPELTFDDGHISNLQIALPILQLHKLTARFFITVGWTGIKPGYMGWDALRSLHQAGQSIGAHGWTHTLLTHCTDRELEKELVAARTTLEDKLGIPITTMSLPGGRYNSRVLNACKQAGYTQVYTSIPKAETLPPGATVGRLNIRGDMQPDWIAQLFAPGSKLLQSIQHQYRRKEALKKLLGDRLYAKLWAFINRQETEAGEDAAA